jgi:hypothetical protein
VKVTLQETDAGSKSGSATRASATSSDERILREFCDPFRPPRRLAVLVFVTASQVGVGAVGIAMLLIFSVVMSLVCMVWVKYDRFLAASQ